MNVIRIATEDLATFLARVVAQHEPPLSQVSLKTIVPSWINFINGGIGTAYGLVSNSGDPAGFLLSFNTIDLIDGNTFAFEYLWLVAPQYRNGDVALKLLRQFEDDAKQAKVAMIICGNNRVFKQDAMRRLYSRLGYKPFSESFFKRVDNAS